MNDNVSKIKDSIYLVLRVALGIIFIAASWDKIKDPKAFADVVENYQILPAVLVNPVAIVLPWVEAVCGVLLISGRLTKGSVLITDILMVIFISAFIFNIYRGLDISCGCFSLSLQAKKGSYILYIIRDLFILAAGLWVLYHTVKKDRLKIHNADDGRFQ